MMRAWTTIGLVLASAAAGAARAEDVPRVLRWADVVHQVDSLPETLSVSHRLRAAAAGVDEAGRVPNPEFEARAGAAMGRGTGDGGAQWGVGLSFPLDWVGQRGAALRVARSTLNAEKLAAAAARREVLARLAERFWRAVYAERRADTLAESEEQVTRLAALIRLRVEKGEARPTELPRIETELERVRVDLAVARGEAAAERRWLAALLAHPAAVDLAVDGGPILPLPPPARDEVMARIRTAHPRILAAGARVVAREAAVLAERTRRAPAFSLGGFFEREPDRDAAGAVVQVTVPLWDWNTPAIRRAEADRAAEAFEAEAETRNMLAAAEAAHERCVRSRDAAARFEREVLSRAEAAARAVERGFELGEVSLIDVLDARRTLLDARRDAIAAAFEARMNCTALAVLTGGIEDAD